MSLESFLTRSWYGKHGWTNVFRPLQPIVKHCVENKRKAFLAFPERSYKAPVPVIVVGNISVGGTGKSPMVDALCKLLINNGYRPGIVSRGHGVKVTSPILLQEGSKASEVGDEPLMLARKTSRPVVVYPKRDLAVQHLLKHTNINIVISDDGMQHYQLDRDIEIAMLDAKRGVGNGQLLPVGPLREPIERLSTVDFVISVSRKITPQLSDIDTPVTLMPLVANDLINLHTGESWLSSQAFAENDNWHIVAGIGNPDRFLETLSGLGLNAQNSSHFWFDDHHDYQVEDIPNDKPVIMTEKDAVKCQAIGLTNKDTWYLPVSIDLPDGFQQAFLDKLKSIKVDTHHE
ncbi:tetraacyldisaccharide 4'-kinase [Marinomonas sp. C2222]|uniref:Tetraacyldisaccharide 4'-kinase n=1 Tax=Marinomonas sargassi TaxID=2984494 RepID=A0ABT2YS89_9GAMM|nr:tetraacyldisaccharide 4'-kinase [Marinomonas sargassi]MCV2402736.1 tetraacyldisaccharide 4'-kinase [Marinomonas sargassi]